MTAYTKALTEKIAKSCIAYPDIFKKLPADITDYLDHFDLPYEGVLYEGGYLKIDKVNVFTQTFTPKNFQKTAFLFHGYFDHTGYFSHVIRLLLQNNIRVIAWDQMGFGLSSGKRAFCNSFDEYLVIAENIIQKFKGDVKDKHIYIGHSAGCSQILSLVRDRKILQQDKILLIAPLVRCISWKVTVLSTSVIGNTLTKVPRVLRRVSSDREFLIKLKSDPLEDKWVDVSWPKALIQWESSLKEIKNPIFSTLVLQGDLDSTVSWRYNMKWLESKFLNLEKIIIKGGRHHLHNENPELLKICLDFIKKFI